ncbi:hypothetical protein R0131_07345 [Clostridium sp. AL.422]|uniref:hypothetical protein n=1 Tax=Clostridium TaxID=1485 RepID=UPI00293DA68C|nr:MULTISPECIES: hypothetical protein [unclassified Clostridium]MDV4150648.1 hypothetical protein [Clostridium sp. AL.422]
MGIFNFFKKAKNDKYDEYEDELEEKTEDIYYENDEKKQDIQSEFKTLEKDIECEAKDDEENNEEKVKLSQEELDELISGEIIRIIDLYDDFKEVKVASYEAAKKIGKANIGNIPKFLNGKVNRPSKYIEKYINEQEWSIVVENSILMIIYSFKEDAVPVLQRVSQKNSKLNLKATNLLCKLASEGVETNKIINWIMGNLIAFNDENKIKILGFMSQIKGNSQVVGLIQHFYKGFVKNGEIEYAYKTLNHLINAAEKFTKGHLKFLKAIAMNKGTLNLDEIMMLEEGDPKSIKLAKIDDDLSIEAAITYFALDKGDDDINSRIHYLSEYSLDRNLRDNLKKLLKE